MFCVSVAVWLSYPQQGAGAVDVSSGQQLAGQVEVSFGLNGRQRDCGSRGEDSLIGGPRSQLLHGSTVLLVEVEGAAGGSRLHGSTYRPVKRHHRETESVDERDGVIEELSLCRETWNHSSPSYRFTSEEQHWWF